MSTPINKRGRHVGIKVLDMIISDKEDTKMLQFCNNYKKHFTNLRFFFILVHQFLQDLLPVPCKLLTLPHLTPNFNPHPCCCFPVLGQLPGTQPLLLLPSSGVILSSRCCSILIPRTLCSSIRLRDERRWLNVTNHTGIYVHLET